MRPIFVTVAAGAIALGAIRPALAQQVSTGGAAGQRQDAGISPAPTTATSEHDHGPALPAITYVDLQHTAAQLTAAREATTKYRDVRAAEADGYRAVGPYVPGMGIHYVRDRSLDAFSIAEPPILLYERDASLPGGLRLAGVSYLLVAPIDRDGQPANPPFPKALARWHKHNNICVLPDNEATVDLTEAECAARGGQFTTETSWMLHAWIWKESPAGVFSPTNPLVK